MTCRHVYSVTNSRGFTPSTEYFSKEVFSEDLEAYRVVRRRMIAYNPSRINVGSVALQDELPEVVVSPLYVVFSVDESRLLPEYLLAFLKSRPGLAQISFHSTGTVRNNLRFETLCQLEMKLPCIELQRERVGLLAALSKQTEDLKKLRASLDDLVKSQFMEIFSECLGDKVSLSDVVWFQEGPGVRNYQYTAHGVKLLNVANLHDGELDISNTGRYISEEEAYGRYRHFLVEEGDLIIASSGIKVDYFDQKMGFAKKEQLPLCMNTSTIRFRAIDSRLNMIFFMYYLKSDDFKQQLARQITGSAQLNFGPSHLKKMSVPMPPFALQQQFADFVAQVDKLGFRRPISIGAYVSDSQGRLINLAVSRVAYRRKVIVNEEISSPIRTSR